jgi:hypothetical protein
MIGQIRELELMTRSLEQYGWDSIEFCSTSGRCRATRMMQAVAVERMSFGVSRRATHAAAG